MATTTPTDAELDALEKRLRELACLSGHGELGDAAAALAALRLERDAAIARADSMIHSATNAKVRANDLAHYLKQTTAERDALREALKEAIEGWEDGAAYKGEYLREKHGDAEGIAKARAVLAETEKACVLRLLRLIREATQKGKYRASTAQSPKTDTPPSLCAVEAETN